jgi:hypothetical protein
MSHRWLCRVRYRGAMHEAAPVTGTFLRLSRNVPRTTSPHPAGVMTATVPAFVAELLHGLRARFTHGPTLGTPAPTLPFGALLAVHGWTRPREDRRFSRVPGDAGGVAVACGGALRFGTALDAVSGGLAGTAHDALEPATVRVWLRGQTA